MRLCAIESGPLPRTERIVPAETFLAVRYVAHGLRLERRGAAVVLALADGRERP